MFDREKFKRLLQAPATADRLKAILGEVIKANQGKTKEQIIAIFEERKKQYALGLIQVDTIGGKTLRDYWSSLK